MVLVVGVVLARGGSKRVPRKNIRMLGGKPVLAYTIEAALNSKVLDRVILSTDDDEIASVGKAYGAEVLFMRPSELSGDDAHTAPVVEHAIKFLEDKEGLVVDVVVTLEPSSPLRSPRHIVDGVDRFLKGDSDSLVSVSVAFPPWWCFYMNDGDRLTKFISCSSNDFNLESQELPKVFMPNGVLYVTKRSYLREHGSVVNPNNSLGLLVDDESALDLDSEVDFLVVEEVLKKRKKFGGV